MPELRPGNATVNAAGNETLGALQEAAAAVGQWLPVDARSSVTIAELCGRATAARARHATGRCGARVLSLGAGGLRFGSEAVKDVAGYDVRRAWLGEVAIARATLRLAARLRWRLDATLRGGDAFALAEALRALPSAPAAILVLAPDLVAILDDARSRRRIAARPTSTGLRGSQAPSSNGSASRAGARAARRFRRPGYGLRGATLAGRCRPSTSPGRTTRDDGWPWLRTRPRCRARREPVVPRHLGPRRAGASGIAP